MSRTPRRPTKARTKTWDAPQVRALRQDLGLSQDEMALRLGVRQQTISEWETGVYAPRGASAMMLGVLAERAERPYRTATRTEQGDG